MIARRVRLRGNPPYVYFGGSRGTQPTSVAAAAVPYLR